MNRKEFLATLFGCFAFGFWKSKPKYKKMWMQSKLVVGKLPINKKHILPIIYVRTRDSRNPEISFSMVDPSLDNRNSNLLG